MPDKVSTRKTFRIGRYLVSTGVNGPGRRFVLWLRGCPLRCKGCFNPEFWDRDGGVLMGVDEIIARINSAREVEGVTFTGGEPFAQAEGLSSLAESIRSRGLSIVCYTGYLLQELLDGTVPYAKDLLKWVDLLIDGRYREEEKAPLPWRGSRNQRVYFLTERYRHLEPLAWKEGTREVELQVGEDGLVMTGFFDLEVWGRLKKTINPSEKHKD